MCTRVGGEGEGARGGGLYIQAGPRASHHQDRDEAHNLHTVSHPLFHTRPPPPPHRFTLDLVQRPLLKEGFVQLQRQTLPCVLPAQVAEAAEANQRAEARLPIRRGGDYRDMGKGQVAEVAEAHQSTEARLPSRGRGRGRGGSLAARSFASLEEISGKPQCCFVQRPLTSPPEGPH